MMHFMAAASRICIPHGSPPGRATVAFSSHCNI